jgi:hypothetical protein
MIITVSKTFFPQHPRKGEPTEFRGKVLSGDKRHTCRQNYEYWKRQIDSVKAKGGVLSVKQWIDRPYHQPGQEPVVDIPADVVGVQRLELRRERLGPASKLVTRWTGPYEWTATVDGRPVPLGALAANDGLTVEDFKAWFAPVFTKAEKKYPASAQISNATTMEFAIIHFTKFRY